MSRADQEPRKGDTCRRRTKLRELETHVEEVELPSLSPDSSPAPSLTLSPSPSSRYILDGLDQSPSPLQSRPHKQTGSAHQSHLRDVNQIATAARHAFHRRPSAVPTDKCTHNLGSGIANDFHNPKLSRSTLQGTLLPVLEGRLYLTCASSSSAFQPKEGERWLTLDKGMCYTPLCADFGPLNLGTTHMICSKLYSLLAKPAHQGPTKIILYTSAKASDITNMITLLVAFLCLRMGYSPEEAFRPFNGLHHGLTMPFRDATWIRSTFDLYVEDCVSGLQRAVCAGIYKQSEFDPREYFYYDDPMNGDMHEVLPGKFIAFRGPVGDDACDSTREGTLSQRCGSTLSALAFFDTFKDKNVSTIIRLNSIEYSAAVFERAGFAHFDLTFEDCGVPSDSIVDNFLRIAEQVPSAVCVCMYMYIYMQ